MPFFQTEIQKKSTQKILVRALSVYGIFRSKWGSPSKSTRSACGQPVSVSTHSLSGVSTYLHMLKNSASSN